MKVLVYDIAAESGGAITILKAVYEKAKNLYKDIEWTFIVSVVDLVECDNIRVVKYPKVKQSWFNRYFFDKITAPKIIKKVNPNVVFNLQNVYVRSNCKQILYMHQSVPFIDYKFKIKELKMWVYQNIIGRMIKKSCRKVDEIIVQTKWVKDAIIKKAKVEANKILVQPPTVDESKIAKYVEQKEKKYFFPANSSPYKNHKVIIDALELLSKENKFPLVVFTLLGNETKLILQLKKRSDRLKLNIEWRGNISYEDVLEMYGKSTLLFPSYVESFGLPLLEARLSGCPIIAADTLFAREICEGYNMVEFFNKDDYVKLKDKIKQKGMK